MELKVNHSYYYQVQGHMQISKRNFCYFVVYLANWMEIQIIRFNDSFWHEKMIEKLKVFYTECLLPEIVNPQYGKRLLSVGRCHFRSSTYFGKYKIKNLHKDCLKKKFENLACSHLEELLTFILVKKPCFYE
ncbi:uncharacterized protein LOC111040483 [Myzus persicae]|uniref:uncharacterized protein LOC111040483 n=1 Tax=Myzus persicae TaxID=13164 RepID=UPI000B9341F4|nr:uncharacterized protein LOC111040483 [Myzus persicae]